LFVETSINKRVEILIEDLGFNNSTFAAKVGVGPQVIQNIVTGRRNKPSFDTIQNMAKTKFLKKDKVVQLNLYWFILGHGEMFLSSDTPENEIQKLKDEFEQMKDQVNGFASTIKKITDFIGLDA